MQHDTLVQEDIIAKTNCQSEEIQKRCTIREIIIEQAAWSLL